MTTPPGRIRRLLRQERVRAALRFALALVVADVVVIHLFGSTTATVLGSFAVIIHLYFLDFDGDVRERLVGQGAAALVGAVAVVLGTVLAQPLWLSVVGAFIVTTLFSYARILRGYVGRSAVGLQGAFFLPLMVPAQITEIPDLVGSWLIGSGIAIVAALVVLPHQRSGAVRRALTAWLDAAAMLAAAIGQRGPRESALQALTTADDALIDGMSGSLARTGSVGHRERALTEMVSRARWSMPVAAQLTALPESDDITLTMASATAFTSAGQLVSGATAPTEVPDLPALREADLTAMAGEPSTDVAGHYPARVLSIAATTMLWLAGVSRGIRMPSPDLGDVTDESPWAVLRADIGWDSVWLRNAVRTGIATAACVLLVRELGLDHGLWVVLAALACIQGTFSGAGSARLMVSLVAGAAGGVTIAGVLLVLQPPYTVFAALLPLAAITAKLLSHSGPFLAQLVYTPFALINLAVLSWPPGAGMDAMRIENIALGVGVAAVLSVAVFPFGLSRLLNQLQAQACALSLAYLEDAMKAARGFGVFLGNTRSDCVRAILLFEHALDAAYIRPTAVTGALRNHEMQSALARDRLVGGDACIDLALRRARHPRMAPIADAAATWWSRFASATLPT